MLPLLFLSSQPPQGLFDSNKISQKIPVLWCGVRKAALLWGSTRSVQRVGEQLPHPSCSGSAAQAAFLQAAAICLFTIVCVAAAAKGFNQNWAGHHTCSNIHSIELDIWNKMMSNDREFGSAFPCPKQEQYGATQVAAGGQAPCCLREVIMSYTHLALPVGGCNSAQHFYAGLKVRYIMDWPHTKN